MKEEQSNVEVSEQLLDPDKTIEYIQKRRLEMIINGVPVDKDTMALLRDTANTAVNVKRITTDKESSKGQAEAALAVAKAISQHKGNPFHISQVIDGESVNVNSNFTQPELPAIETVPGETMIGLDDPSEPL